MPKPMSVDSVIDKNKITSGAVWVILLDIEIVDPNSRDIVEVIHIARNDEDVTFNGTVYKAGNFELSIDQRNSEAPSVSVTAQDQIGYIQQRLESVAGGVFSNVVMTVVNTNRLDKPAEVQERFQVTQSHVKGYAVTVELGAENPLSVQFPKHVQAKDRCAWRYKGYGCRYTGSLPACDYSKDGPMGCVAHNNVKNFRALPGLVRMNI